VAFSVQLQFINFAHFAVQVAAIFLASRLVAVVLRRLGQSPVIAEVVAGILLGPTLFARVAPDAFAWLFSKDSMAMLRFFSQVGIVIFMFGVGLEFDQRMLKHTRRPAMIISFVSIALPFTIGLSIAKPLAACSGAPVSRAFPLFIATAMSITAFPVLARIVRESRIALPIAGLSLTAAAVDDVSAWVLLALVSSIAMSTSINGVVTMIALVVVLGVLVLKVMPRIVERWHASAIMPLAVLLVTALASEWIGVHAVFGAFIAGVALPLSYEERVACRKRLRPLELALMPLFFAVSGLRTNLGFLTSSWVLIATVVVVAAACIGKFGGGTIAAKFCGLSWIESLTVGALMNTRGLMELVVLNIGLDLRVLTPEFFAIFVVMALTTTFATGPALKGLRSLEVRRNPVDPAVVHVGAADRVTGKVS